MTSRLLQLLLGCLDEWWWFVPMFGLGTMLVMALIVHPTGMAGTWISC